jgi:hypothetical protein
MMIFGMSYSGIGRLKGLRRDPGRSNPPARAGRAALGETALRAFSRLFEIHFVACAALRSPLCPMRLARRLGRISEWEKPPITRPEPRHWGTGIAKFL